MGMVESALKGLGFGVGLGLGYVVVTRLLFPGSGDQARPIAKAAVRSYLDLAEKYGELAAEMREKFSDLMAEVKAEREACREATAAARDAASETE